MCLGYKSFETLGKGEIVHNEQFLLFPVFSTRFHNFLQFTSNLKLLSVNSFSLESLKLIVWERVNPSKTKYPGLFQIKKYADDKFQKLIVPR